MLYNYGVLLSLKLLIKINRNRNTNLKIKRHHNKPFLMHIAFNPFHPNCVLADINEMLLPSYT